MADFTKRYIIRRAYPSIYEDVVFVSGESMKEVLSDHLKKVDKHYNLRLDSIAIDNEALALQLKDKDRNYDQLNKEYRTQKERCFRLEQEKKSLERKIQDEIRNSNRLSREIDNLQWTKKNLQEYIDKIQSENIDELRKIV